MKLAEIIPKELKQIIVKQTIRDAAVVFVWETFIPNSRVPNKRKITILKDVKTKLYSDEDNIMVETFVCVSISASRVPTSWASLITLEKLLNETSK
jgi:hypothetical protein